MRVLHVHSGNLWGGIESFLLTLARRAALAPDLRSEFALCFDGRLGRELAQTEAPLFDLGRVHTRSPWSVIRARRALTRLLTETKYDAVVCHSAWSQAMFGAVPRALAVPGVFYLHDRVRPRHFLERWAARHTPSFCIANSEFTRSGLSGIFPHAGVSVVHYPIDAAAPRPSAEERRALRTALGVSEDTVVIVQASRMQPWKGQDRLLRALARIPPPAAWLCLEIGDAQRPSERAYREKLEADARALGVTSRVRFLGQRDDVPRLLAASDIHCQPNAEPEPFGIVFIEALLAGLPILTFDMGGPHEIVNKDVGILVQDEASLAVELERLVNDRALRERLGSAGPARAKELCDPAARLAELTNVIERVVTSVGSRAGAA